MPRCTRKGCGQEFDPSNNTEESCSYHSGGPVFHEGLKSWSCCQDVNKPVLDFDEFMKIPGCTTGSHTDEVPKVDPLKQSSPNVNLKSVNTTQVAKEAPAPQPTSTPAAQSQTFTVGANAPRDPVPLAEEEEDDLSVTVPPGTTCRHKGCEKGFVSDAVSRNGDEEEAICTYHPLPPIFHEGSKGYLCCKRRVLEFDEFLKIEGCKKGRHVFVPKSKGSVEAEQLTDCRIDHYQTPTEVHVSVFAKQADKERSTVKIESNTIHLDLYLPASKRFRRSIDLFGPINPETSSFKYYGTKVELVLKKQDSRVWPLLEKTDRDIGPISFTFGVGGRTGTIGGKEIVLDSNNATKLQD